MANYDFSTLNATDLEELARDLLNDAQPQGSPICYITYKEGKDRGIDLLYSTDNKEHEHVGQVKHYYRSGYSKLLSDLKNKELAKVKALAPSRYIVLTSVDLSPDNAKAIKKVFEPYLRNLSDIYGKNDLNALIDKNPSILERHYKLWLADFSIITMILGSPLKFRSSLMADIELKKRLRVYIKTALFDTIRDTLARRRYVIITGEPGVGKTTLAEMLAYQYIGEHYQMSYVTDAKEAEAALVADTSKQVIYFDDFLGSTAVEINKAQGTQTHLLTLLTMIPKLENKFLILTTRSQLLNTAVQQSEKLRRHKLKDNASVFELKQYDEQIKANLYKNHVEEAEIDAAQKETLLSTEIVEFVSNHEYFNPRAIEFLISPERLTGLQGKKLTSYLYHNFKVLDEIWLHAYSEQLNEEDRMLLSTLVTFRYPTRRDILEKAYQKRLQYEVRNNNYRITSHTFMRSMERLEGDFIYIDKDLFIQLINPSLEDFLVKHIAEDSYEVDRIVHSLAYAEQLSERLYSLASMNVRPMPQELQQELLSNYRSFVDPYHIEYDLIQLAMVINRFIPGDEKFDVIAHIIREIRDFEALRENYDLNMHFREFIASIKGNDEITELIQERVMEIINDLVTGEYEAEDAVELLNELTSDFDIELEYMDTDTLQPHFEEIINEHIDSEIAWLYEYITDPDEANEKKSEIQKMIDALTMHGIEVDTNISDFDVDWYETAMENEMRRLNAKDN